MRSSVECEAVLPGSRPRVPGNHQLYSLNSTSTPMSLNPLPWPYYFTFAIYEPLLGIVSGIWAFANPREVNGVLQDYRKGELTPYTLHLTRHLTPRPHGRPRTLQGENDPSTCQCKLSNGPHQRLHHPCRHFTQDPKAQEVVYKALFTVLMFGDFAHIGVTLYAMGPMRWEVGSWSALTWVTILAGVSLLVPRALWHLGVGRGVPTAAANSKVKKRM